MLGLAIAFLSFAVGLVDFLITGFSAGELDVDPVDGLAPAGGVDAFVLIKLRKL